MHYDRNHLVEKDLMNAELIAKYDFPWLLYPSSLESDCYTQITMFSVQLGITIVIRTLPCIWPASIPSTIKSLI